MQSTASHWEVNLLAQCLQGVCPPRVHTLGSCMRPLLWGGVSSQGYPDFCWVMLSPLLVLLVLMDWFLPVEGHVLC